MTVSIPAPVAGRLREQPAFLRLLVARVLGTGANQMLMVALGWQVYDLTSSAWQLGLVGLVQFVPALLFTLPAGQLADRHDRCRLLVAALLLQTVVATWLGLGSHQGWITPDGVLATPPLDEYILASITRKYVIELTGAEERSCTREDLEQASEAFLASTTREVQPVAAIEDIELNAPGKRTQEAAADLRTKIQEALAAGG